MQRDFIPDRLAAYATSQPDAPALTAKAADGTWLPVTWSTYHRRVRSFGAACVAVGLQKGGVIGILGENRPEWVYAAVGVMTAGGVASGIYQTSTPEQILYILAHAEAAILVIENQAYWDRIKDRRAELPALRRVVFMSGEPEPGTDPLCQSFAAFLKSGEGHEAEVEARLASLTGADLASLIYTSGTTGNPKGVMLSHDNLQWTAKTGNEMIDRARPDDIVVSYLPLSHIAEQMFTIYLPITGGYQVYFAGGIDKVKETLLVARPTIFLAVPRVWEKFKSALELRLKDAKGAKKYIVGWARSVGTKAGKERLLHGEPGGLLGIQERVAHALFFSKLKGALGFDRVRMAISGAAPISQEVLEFFLSLQIPIMEVYGQSEDTGPTSFNIPLAGRAKLGTVGRPIPGLEVKIAQDGEILVKGRNVFQGYYKDPAATAETLQDGWLHSGDVGEFDADGFLRITDRKKDLIKTSGGKYAAPQIIEKDLKGIPVVSQAVVIGDNRKYLTALLTLDPDKAKHYAQEAGLSQDLPQLANDPRLISFVQGHVDRINSHLARYETIKQFTVLASDFSVEGGELTPSQKIRRKVVGQKYAKLIDAMYEKGGAD